MSRKAKWGMDGWSDKPGKKTNEIGMVKELFLTKGLSYREPERGMKMTRYQITILQV